VFEPISEYGNYFVGIDGEGVGNERAYTTLRDRDRERVRADD